MYDAEFANKLIGTLAYFIVFFGIFVFASIGCIICTLCILKGCRGYLRVVEKDISPPVLNKLGVKIE